MNSKNSRYSRNRIYIGADQQDIIKSKKILLAGAGIGSYIAECALRLGFENITIIDGDDVELSNLNRQNYSESDLNTGKVDTLYKRLKSINSKANIEIEKVFIDHSNIDRYTAGYDIAVNAMDFTSDVPLIFDSSCQSNGIYVLHPFNLGWGGLVGVISPGGLNFNNLITKKRINELRIVEFFSDHEKVWNQDHQWIDDILNKYKNEAANLSPPQLSIGTFLVGAVTTKVMFDIAVDNKIKDLPNFYFVEC